MTGLVPVIHVAGQGNHVPRCSLEAEPNRREELPASRSRTDEDDRDKPGHDGDGGVTKPRRPTRQAEFPPQSRFATLVRIPYISRKHAPGALHDRPRAHWCRRIDRRGDS